MEYNRIVAVTGMPGLYEILNSKNDGALVRSLEEGTTKFVSSRVHNLSHLESIEIYTSGENVNLVDVFTAMKENGAALPDVKDNTALRGYFETVYPDMDFERVYASDMKKMVKWYETLLKTGVEIKLTEGEEGDESEESTEAETETVTAAETAEAPKAKGRKKAAEPQADLGAAEGEAPAEEKPKRTRKKKEDGE
ncbi:MAG: hypothetical protein JWP27_1639 [Flaviaesturariibacter sp.]|nr:hypothetical protein [Flaviaesturariibacter sp.]